MLLELLHRWTPPSSSVPFHVPVPIHLPPAPFLLGYSKAMPHIKKRLQLLSLSHLELILLHHELQSCRSITAHLHIFH